MAEMQEDESSHLHNKQVRPYLHIIPLTKVKNMTKKEDLYWKSKCKYNTLAKDV